MNKILLSVGGAINLLLGIFHLSFWKIFNWPETIASLDFMNKAIMQVLNIHTAFVILVFALVSFFFQGELMKTRIGRLITGIIMVFYFLRAANQMIFWNPGHPLTWAMTLVFIAIGMVYLVPFASAVKNKAGNRPMLEGATV